MSSTPMEPVTTTKPITRDDPRTRRFPPYHVIIENDDHHSFEFVMEVLMKVLSCGPEQAFQFTEEAHTSGRAVIWTGPKEIAELKAEQVQTFHETRGSDGAKLGPLGCIIEEAPGS